MVQFKKWQVLLVTIFSFFAIFFSLPNFLSKDVLEKIPIIPKEKVILGLDLQGGSYLLIEVNTKSLVSERLESYSDDLRKSLKKNKIFYSNFNIDKKNISLTIKNKEKKTELLKILENKAQDIFYELDQDKFLKVSFTAQKIKSIEDNAVKQSIEVVRRRVDEFGTKEPTIQRQGLNRILLELPGVTEPERLKKLLGQTAKLSLQIVDDDLSPDDLKSGKNKPGIIIYESDEKDLSGDPFLIAVKKRNAISGDLLINAFPTIDRGSPVVSFEFNTKGGRKFARITTDNIGKKLAIVLDKKVISSPNIREPITGGKGIITGNFTFQEATDLSTLLRAGALPAPLNILEERTVGPSLGADSIESGKFASILGFTLIIVLMYLCYGTFGLFANLALIFNLLILLAILTSIKATLTLPGIAGIVLTIGMAVDANVLIFERIKEEMKHGFSPIATIDTGYKEAFKTILDANITTLIAAIMLFGLGSGPVKGFAVTLSIGILTSMFTAIMFTRILIIIWLKKTNPERINL